MTATMIAAEIGCSRNAVIGKAHRLGLHQMAPIDPVFDGRDHAADGFSSVDKRPTKATKGPRRPFVWRPRIVPRGAVVVGICELKDDQCHWPVTDGYCGLPVTHRSYCTAHATIAYVVPRGSNGVRRPRWR